MRKKVLEADVEEANVERLSLLFLALLAQHLEGHLLAARADVHVGDTDVRRPLDDLVGHIEEDDNGRSEELEEEVVDAVRGRHVGFADGECGNVELEDDDEDAEEAAEPGSVHAQGSGPGQLLNRVATLLPCLAEANVAEAERAPGEDRRQTGKGKEPVEDCRGRRCVDEEGKEAHE